MAIKFKTEEKKDLTVVEFELDGPISPEELKSLEVPKVNLKKGVVISGRGPVWFFAFLVHEYHPSKWVGTFDPRLGAVVVQSHDPTVEVGDVIEV